MPRDKRDFPGTIGTTYLESQPWWPQPVTPPKDAPNIVFIVLDDVGYSDLGCYGSEIQTRYIDGLAAKGLRYSNFHVTSMCSPTRACLLTGRNAHAVGVGIIAEWSSGFPGYEGKMSKRAATIPEVLRDHGYGTYAVGKWHLTNISDYGSAGPHDDWPLGRGFNRWYGFHGALTDQWNPELVRDNTPVRLTPGAGYHLSGDLVDQAIGDVRDHLTSAPDRPFFLYLAFGACHWPHHVPRDFIDRYGRAYNVGWDAIRSERLRKQKKLGIVPPKTELAPRNPGVSSWDELSPEVQRLCTRLQATYAGFLEHTDSQIGRFLRFLETAECLDNTLVVLLSDNGASAEGGPTGALNLRKHMVYEEERAEIGLARIEDIGSEYAYNHYPTGWAQVSNTPLKWYKKGAHGGGIRAPLVVHWPRSIRLRGGICTQFHHAVDIAPTLYEVLGVEAPQEYRGIEQLPVHGTSMRYTFDRHDVPTAKETQYFELLGNRAIWHRGWKAVARHPKGASFDADQWELYNLETDFAERNDLSALEPVRLRQMIDLWWEEARKHQVLPLDDRDWERAAARLRTRTTKSYEYYADMARIDRLSAPDITNRSYRIRADFLAHPAGTSGVILAWGSRFGGFVLYLKDAELVYEYVYSETQKYIARAPFPAVSNRVEVLLAFLSNSGGAGHATLSINGNTVATIDIPRTWPTHGTTAGLNCGLDVGAPVSDAYARPFRFNGSNLRVRLELVDTQRPPPGTAYDIALKEQ